MESLPWAVVVGEWFWLVAVATGALAHLVLGALLPRFTARLRAARQRLRLGEPVPLETAEIGPSVTLTGTLRAGETLTKRFDDGGDAAVVTAGPHRPAYVLGALAISRAAEGLTLDVGGVEVGIEGDVEVLAGSREVIVRSRFSKLRGAMRRHLVEVDESAFDALGTYRAAFRSLAPGDAVRIRGFLGRKLSSSGGEGYRVASAGWTLAAEPDSEGAGTEERTVAAAFEGTPVAVLPRGLWFLRRVAVTILTWAGVVAVVGGLLSTFVVANGAVLAGRWVATHTPRGCRDLAFGGQTTFAFLLPFWQDEKLRLLERRLVDSCTWDEERVDQLAAVQRLRGRSLDALGTLFEHGAFPAVESRESLVSDHSYGRPVANMLFALGRFDRVAARESTLPYTPREQAPMLATTAVLRGQRLEVIRLARQRARSPQRADPVHAIAETAPNRRRITDWDYACLADALDRGVVDAESNRRLRAHVELGRLQTACPLLDAATRGDTGERHRALVDFAAGYANRHRWAALMLVAAEDPASIEEARTNYVGRELRRPIGDAVIAARPDSFTGLEARALERLDAEETLGPKTTVVRAELRARAAWFESTLGKYAAAARHARGVVDDLERLDPLAHPERLRFSWYVAALARHQLLVHLAGNPEGALDERIRRAFAVEPRPYPNNLVDVEVLLRVVNGDRVQHSTLRRVLGEPDYSSSVDAVASRSAVELRHHFGGRSSWLRQRMIPFWLAERRGLGPELTTQIRWSSRGRDHDRHRLWSSLRARAWSLAAARFLGDEEWASEVEPIVERLREAHLRPETALWLHVTEGR